MTTTNPQKNYNMKSDNQQPIYATHVVAEPEVYRTNDLGVFGTDPTVQLIGNSQIKIVHKAKFRPSILDYCDWTNARKYFWVFENGTERTSPYTCALCSTGRHLPKVVPCIGHIGLTQTLPVYNCFVIPPNCCCPGIDNIEKEVRNSNRKHDSFPKLKTTASRNNGHEIKENRTFSPQHFDRDHFDMQSCCWYVKCLNGAPSAYGKERSWMCCCMKCCSCWSQCIENQFPCICGDRVRILPFQKCCWVIPNSYNWFCNCCSLCGFETGDPICMDACYLNCLVLGEGEKVAAAINNSRADWTTRTHRP